MPSAYVSHHDLCDSRHDLGNVALWTSIASPLAALAIASGDAPFSVYGWLLLYAPVGAFAAGALLPGHNGPDDCPKRPLLR
jgi:hypothetical protein